MPGFEIIQEENSLPVTPSGNDQKDSTVNADENISKQQSGTETVATEIINPSPTENMEVHKHPHHVTHKKKWEEYVLEFFMLFLAVFLGFIAENIRETNMIMNGKSSMQKNYTMNFLQIQLRLIIN